MNVKLIGVKAFVAAISLLTSIASAQNQPTAPPGKQTTFPQTQGAYDWLYRAGLTCGAGASTSTVATKPTTQCGGVLGFPFFDLEAGVIGTQ